MKRLVCYFIVLISSFLVSSCCTHANFLKDQTNPNLIREDWIQRINTDPNVWIKNAESWYFTGKSMYDKNIPVSESMTSMKIKVPNFTKLSIAGSFQVQIIGNQDHNSVSIVGPNAYARAIGVTYSKKTLYITEALDSKLDTRHVIVRVGVRSLNCITTAGDVTVIGRGIDSQGLTIKTMGSGNMILSGNLAINYLTQTGSGTTTILGAYTPSISIRNLGNGTINISGRVGVEYISNLANGCVNIIGADTDKLNIDTDHFSRTTVLGYVNLKHVNACGNSRIYVYWVDSNGMYVNIKDHAIVALAGCVSAMNIDVFGDGCFKGKYLNAGVAYVKTHNYSHANIAANKRIFASALDYSSIYYFGPPIKISRFIAGYGTIIALQGDQIPKPAVFDKNVRWEFMSQRNNYQHTLLPNNIEGSQQQYQPWVPPSPSYIAVPTYSSS